jgi:hypothetical protein
LIEADIKPQLSGAVTKEAEGNAEKTPKFAVASPANGLTA